MSKNFIIECDSKEQIRMICENFPINKEELPFTAKSLYERIISNRGQMANIRITNGAICGHGFRLGTYEHPMYTHIPFAKVFPRWKNFIAFGDRTISIEAPTIEDAKEILNTIPTYDGDFEGWLRHWNDYEENSCYMVADGHIRYIGRAELERNVFALSEVKETIQILTEVFSGHNVRIRTFNQMKWMYEHVTNNTFATLEGGWGWYKSNSVFAIRNAKIESIVHKNDLHDDMSFSDFKKLFTKYEKLLATPVLGGKKMNIHCRTAEEVRYVCNKHGSKYSFISNADIMNYFIEYGSNTVYEIINGKITAAFNKTWALPETPIVPFDAAFPNATKEKDFYICEHCGKPHKDTQWNVVNGKLICDECITNYTRCEACGKLELTVDMIEVDGRKICNECVQNKTTTCLDCGERHFTNEMYRYNDGYVCRACSSNTEKYVWCSRCDKLILRSEAIRDGSHYYCESCWESHITEGYIHDYFYKPDPMFYGEGNRYFGVELEVDGEGEDSRNAYHVLSSTNINETRVYAKHDGSLDEGFEIVSHPMTLDYHTKEMNWSEIMKKAISLGYRSHQTPTCGLHVHVSRDSLGSTVSEQEENIAKILYFVELHWNEIVTFTRRTYDKINRWAARFGYENEAKKILDKAKDSGHYAAINLNNEHTIEFRVFRGTLKYNTFIATLQLVNKVCDFACSMSERDIESTSWLDFVAGIEEPELIQYLKERNLYVNEPTENTEEEM